MVQFSIVRCDESAMMPSNLQIGEFAMTKRMTMGLALVMMASPLFAQQPTATDAAKTTAKPERKICKRSAPSGSLIETRRECHTRAEWDQMAQAARAQGQDMVDRASPTGR